MVLIQTQYQFFSIFILWGCKMITLFSLLRFWLKWQISPELTLNLPARDINHYFVPEPEVLNLTLSEIYLRRDIAPLDPWECTRASPPQNPCFDKSPDPQGCIFNYIPSLGSVLLQSGVSMIIESIILKEKLTNSQK